MVVRSAERRHPTWARFAVSYSTVSIYKSAETVLQQRKNKTHKSAGASQTTRQRLNLIRSTGKRPIHSRFSVFSADRAQPTIKNTNCYEPTSYQSPQFCVAKLLAHDFLPTV